MFLKFCEVPGGVHLQFKNTCTLDLIYYRLQVLQVYPYLIQIFNTNTKFTVHVHLLLLEGVPQLYLLYNLDIPT
jgi:hypothetical protein